MANHKDTKTIWNNNVIVIKEGQLLTGRKSLAEQTGIPETTIEDILKYLETRHQIRQQKTTKFRIITILNWTTYQNSDIKSNNKATTKRQQSDTNKNDKNDKNDKKDIIRADGAGLEGVEINKIIELFRAVNPSVNQLFGRKNQRDAIKRLEKMFGREELENTIRILPSINSRPYAPIATTPLQLEEKAGRIKAFCEQEKSKEEKTKFIKLT